MSTEVSIRSMVALLAACVHLQTSNAGVPGCPEAGSVVGESKISALSGGFFGDLDPNDQFGRYAAGIRDLDGDGVDDLAVGASLDDDGGTDRGAVWILFLNDDGTVKSHSKISSTEGGFAGPVRDGDQLGYAIVPVGDLDGDGRVELAVTAGGDDDGGADRGAVWILFLNSDGTVRASQKISSTSGGFVGPLDNADVFGAALAAIGDLDGDGVSDLAVGAPLDDDGGTDRGAVWILFLNPDGTVKAQQKISSTTGGFVGPIDNFDRFGVSAFAPGDIDGDGIHDLFVGAYYDDDGGADRGAFWVLFLNTDGTVRSEQKISDTAGGFQGQLDNADLFGAAFAGLGDLDGDGVEDFAVAASLDDDGGSDRGAVWVLYMNANGTVKAESKISSTSGGFTGPIDNFDLFAVSLAMLGDLDNDGRPSIAVCAPDDDDGGLNTGAVWILEIQSCIIPPSIVAQPVGVMLDFPGGPVSLSVAAEGTGELAYQWRRDGEPLVDGAAISGAATPTLSLQAGPDLEGVYDCVVSSAFGEQTSLGAIVGIRPNPCPADLTGNSLLDLNDINAFIQAFTGGCP